MFAGVPARDGAADGIRTHSLLITNQLLCQLSYDGMAGSTGFEPVERCRSTD